jgi:hypothetical protein
VVLTALHAFLDPVVGVSGGRPIPDDHLQGTVAEQLWHFVQEGRRDIDGTIRIEPPSFKVTDQGGDGLTIRRRADLSLSFVLWEIKKRTGSGSLAATANRAGKQLKLKALEYLARYTCTTEQLHDAQLESLYAHLVEYWEARSDVAAAGVAVSGDAKSVSKRCFASLPKNLSDFSSNNRLTGQITAVGDFAAFARDVRDIVWTGL